MHIYMRLLLVLMLSLVQLPAETPAAKSQPAETNLNVSERRLESIRDITVPLQQAAEDVKVLTAELKSTKSPESRAGIELGLQAARERLDSLRQDFLKSVGGAEAAEYDGTNPDNLTLQEQLVELVQPLLSALSDASADPRELESLRGDLGMWKERKRKADVILDRINAYQEIEAGDVLQKELTRAQRYWEGKRAESTGQIGVIESRIYQRETRKRPFWESMSDMFGRFFRSRGLNLLFAMLAGVVSYLLVRRIYTFVCRYSPLHRKKRATLPRRVADISVTFLSVLIAVWAVMMVFYLRGDWLLLTLVAMMLLGAAWAAKQSLPPYIEQIRTLLNLGSIREGERIVHLGLPWKVRTISFFTTLENPDLQGGELRIPIRDLMGMMSREHDPKEPWFPTRVDDWVLMGDDTHGKVVTQTPEQVVVLHLGGSLKTYPSAEYLLQRPENLSNGYRVDTVFGIDYKHQSISTTEVPAVFERAITEALFSKFDRESIRSIKVELNAAGASSLDYRVIVDVDGSHGSRYRALKRLIQSVCVDTCNAQGWVIPFTQITVHQAEAPND